jgi:Holliday junction resolvasome RuvABC ATP-dependent DNA helicase subunit
MKDHFVNIIGQSPIINRLKVSVNAPIGAKLAQPIFFGEAGLGKTEIAKSYCNAIAEKLDCEPLFFNSPAEFRHSESSELNQLLNWFSQESGVLVIDECHLFEAAKTVSMQRVQGFILKCLDAQNTGKTIQFDQDNSFSYDKSKKVIIMMTNHKNKIDSALVSRMDSCDLQQYTHHELEKICVQMLANEEMSADSEKTLALLAKASRGSARPLYNMIQQFSRMGVDLITFDVAITTMRDLNMFPRGLVRDELHLLEKAKNPITSSIAKSLIVGLQGNMAKSVAYLFGHGLLSPLSGGSFKTSEKGKFFLERLEKLGFI